MPEAGLLAPSVCAPQAALTARFQHLTRQPHALGPRPGGEVLVEALCQLDPDDQRAVLLSPNG
jgi:hypothetical protein